MSEVEEANVDEQQDQHPITKLTRYSKFVAYGTLSALWIVTAVLGTIDLVKGKGITETPWIIFGLVLAIPVVFFVIVPLFRSLKKDVKDYKERHNID